MSSTDSRQNHSKVESTVVNKLKLFYCKPCVSALINKRELKYYEGLIQIR